MEHQNELLTLLYAEYERLTKELESVRSLILLKGGKLPEVNYNLDMTNPVPKHHDDEYPLKGSWEDKIKYVIQVIGASYVPEIVEYLRKQEPDLDEKKVFNAVTHYSSKMAKEGSLIAEKKGVKNKYSIK